MPTHALSGRLKDEAGAALITFLLGIPMIGLTTIDAGGALKVVTRWHALGIFVVAVFAGRLLLQWALVTLVNLDKTS